ncbi:uncharacterized protein PG998_006870 [Apiospora kogelbergensis]|uniref:uncharacterized protein n=1 Tax=Apiospora kogelbergensis TaxID=1337665 RepID=UPI00313023D9
MSNEPHVAFTSTRIEEEQKRPFRRPGDMKPQNIIGLKLSQVRRKLARLYENGRSTSQGYRATALPVRKGLSWAKRDNVKNVRKLLAVTINSHEEKACPDSGSSQNIMREDWAREHKLKIRRTSRDRMLFQLGNGKSIRAMGRVRAHVRISRAQSLSQSRRKEWFYIFENCPVPIVLGLRFLDCASIFTTNKHLLEDCPKAYSDIDSVLWIGTPRNQMRCSLDGQRAVATADTGSDLNLMSLEYTKRNGYCIDDRPEMKRLLQFGDGSTAETMGQVHVNNFSLDWRCPPITSGLANDKITSDEKPQYGDGDVTDEIFVLDQVVFHVLPDLPCDIILGRPLLEATDAFSQRDIQLASFDHRFKQKRNMACFNIVIKLRWTRDSSKKRVPTRQDHENEQHAHLYRLSLMEEDIDRLTGLAKQEKLDEMARVKTRWETEHRQRGCAFCI